MPLHAPNARHTPLGPLAAEVDRRTAVLQQAGQILDVTIQAKHFFFPGKFHH
ncbi:MAG TPA: hypothetical protein V6D08_04415 [Candidatus Obscuribacterales bacterium]